MLLSAIGIAVAALLATVATLCFQRTLVYSPRRYSAEEEQRILDRLQIPSTAPVHIVSADKTVLRAYWMPVGGEDRASVPTVLYLHVSQPVQPAAA